jgi:hypothetical protein
MFGCGGKDRIYTPLMTLWVFLTQVLSADHSCRGALARLVAHRLSQGQSPCSPETGAYCPGQEAIAVEVLCGRDLSPVQPVFLAQKILQGRKSRNGRGLLR